MTWTILNANADSIPLTDKSVQCVVTSPPYWGLRDYGQIGQIGLEATPEAYVEKIVAVFAEVWRVLRDDGTCWVNLGDSYCTGTSAGRQPGNADFAEGTAKAQQIARNGNCGGLKAKDLVGIPWRVAFALQAAGWYLRSDIIWSKPNPMPESVTDRPTKAHEYIFLLSKKERYFFDQDAVREITGNEATAEEYAKADGRRHFHEHDDERGMQQYNPGFKSLTNPAGRNIRTVWEIATQPYPNAHFATFPEEIAVRCIKAGTSEKGACAECGAPWERVTDVSYDNPGNRTTNGDRSLANREFTAGFSVRLEKNSKTLGWQPTCKHEAGTVPCIVLDPFSGAGTVPLVADKLNRRGIGLELKADYCRMAERRCYDDAPLLAAMEG